MTAPPTAPPAARSNMLAARDTPRLTSIRRTDVRGIASDPPALGTVRRNVLASVDSTLPRKTCRRSGACS